MDAPLKVCLATYVSPNENVYLLGVLAVELENTHAVHKAFRYSKTNEQLH